MSDTTHKPRSVERRIRGLVVLYSSTETSPAGERIKVPRRAMRGELVTLDVAEVSRLDALGMLAEIGATEEDLEADLAASQRSYREARQSVVEAGVTVL
jgi:hypothetical protein